MKLGDEIKRSWKISEERVIRDELAISGLASRLYKFRSDVLFDAADGARAIRMLAHDAIPPAEGTVRLSRDRDMVSVDFDGAGVRAGDGRGPSMKTPREERILRSVLACGVFFYSVTANAYSRKKGLPTWSGPLSQRTEFARTLQNVSFAALAFLRNSA
jgi:hypothetical protein